MNNYQFRSKRLVNTAVFAAFLSITGLSSVVAQQLNLPPIQDVGVSGQAAPLPSYNLPEGASLEDVNSKLQELSSEGARSLQSLVGNSTSVREMNDIEDRSADQREINKLTLSLEKARLAKELFKTINGDDQNFKAELEAVKAERDALAVQISAIEQQLIRTTKLMAEQSSGSNVVNPVVVRIVGAANDLTATLLVPVTGQTIVKVGDMLSNGQTVSSITPKGVSVSSGSSKNFKLSFGTSVASR